MAGYTTPYFQNDGGYNVIEIGASEFMCVGAKPPFDHPHVYLDMGDEGEKVCSYCSTLYKLNASLARDESLPPDCAFHDHAG